MKTTTCFVLAIAALSLPLAAQEPAGPRMIPTVTFSGEEPLSKVFDLLQEETGVGIIVDSQLATTLPAPKMMLMNVTVESVMTALRELFPYLGITKQGAAPNEIYTIIRRGDVLPAQVFPNVTRIFKASEAGVTDAEFEKLLDSVSTVSDLAVLTSGRMHNEKTFAQCKANMNCNQCHAPGRNDAVFRDFKPIIEAHRPTSIIVVSGKEDKVDLVGRVIEVLGGSEMRRGAGTASAASPRSTSLRVKYLKVTELMDTLKSDLGGGAVAAVISHDPRTNVLVLNEAHPDAESVRLLVERLDQRPMTLVVKTTVKRVNPQHPEGVVLARPTLATLPGKTSTITIGDKDEQLTIELTVTPEGTAEGLSDALKQARREMEQKPKPLAEREKSGDDAKPKPIPGSVTAPGTPSRPAANPR